MKLSSLLGVKTTANAIIKSKYYTRRLSTAFNLDKVLSQNEKLLLTPGPLSVSPSVRQALTRGIISNDFYMQHAFRSMNKQILDQEIPVCVDNVIHKFMCIIKQIAFISLISSVRKDILDIAQVNDNEYTSVLMQGSGTFCVEVTILNIVEVYFIFYKIYPGCHWNTCSS